MDATSLAFLVSIALLVLFLTFWFVWTRPKRNSLDRQGDTVKNVEVESSPQAKEETTRKVEEDVSRRAEEKTKRGVAEERKSKKNGPDLNDPRNCFPMSMYPTILREVLQSQAAGAFIAPAQIDVGISEIGLRCVACGYHLSFSERKALLAHASVGAITVSGFGDSGKLNPGRCPQCGNAEGAVAQG